MAPAFSEESFSITGEKAPGLKTRATAIPRVLLYPASSEAGPCVNLIAVRNPEKIVPAFHASFRRINFRALPS